jgi:hypothetical protein
LDELGAGFAVTSKARLLKGVIPFSMSAAIEALHTVGLAPGDYFRLVAEVRSGAEVERLDVSTGV